MTRDTEQKLADLNQPPLWSGINAYRSDPLLVDATDAMPRGLRDEFDAIGRYVTSPEAQELANGSEFLAPAVALLREEGAYRPALTEIASLRPVVDAFFDKVMVLDADEKVRGANLGLIDQVLRNFSGIADFSEIVTA